MVFGNVAAFWLLPIVLLVAIIGLWGWRAKREIIKIWLNAENVKRSQIKKYILIVTMLVIVILAIAIPKVPFVLPGNAEKEGLIVFMVDVSGSMAAQKDLDSPNRLERVKPMLQEIIDEFPEARFYPFHFTSIARSLTPVLTKADFPYLKRSIVNVLDIYSAPGENSSLGTPILQVVNKIYEEEKVKIIVLFSDGEFFKSWNIDTGEEPSLDRAIRKAVQENIKIITVGVGEREGATIPLYNEKGEFTGEFAEHNDKVFVSRLEEEKLQLIASETQGKYFFEEDFDGVIDFLNKNLESGKGGNDYQDISYLLLIPVAVLWIIFARLYLR